MVWWWRKEEREGEAMCVGGEKEGREGRVSRLSASWKNMYGLKEEQEGGKGEEERNIEKNAE